MLTSALWYHLAGVFGELPSLRASTGATGIQLLPHSALATLALAVCRVCGVIIDRKAVACAKCRAPHHKDCWTYNGGRCSTYACGSEKCDEYVPGQ